MGVWKTWGRWRVRESGVLQVMVKATDCIVLAVKLLKENKRR